MNQKIVKSLLKNTWSVASWFLPSAIYFKFEGLDAALVAAEVPTKQNDDFKAKLESNLEKLLNEKKDSFGQICELSRDFAGLVSPLIAFGYDKLYSILSSGEEINSNYAKICLVAYVVGTVFGAIAQNRFKNLCIREAYCCAHYDKGVEYRVALERDKKSSIDWEKFEEEFKKYKL